MIAAYVPLRLWFAGGDFAEWNASSKRRATAVLAGALIFAFGLAMVQLLPTLELKRLSQRASADDHELGFGAIPLWYLSQTIRPWHWYSPGVLRDKLLEQRPPAFGRRTNQVEAHLYFGLLPTPQGLFDKHAVSVVSIVVPVWAIVGGIAVLRWRSTKVVERNRRAVASGLLNPSDPPQS